MATPPTVGGGFLNFTDSDDVYRFRAGETLGLPVRALGGNDSLVGSEDDDNFFGNLGNDTLIGLAGNDDLRGGQGNDFLDGGEGNDSLFGNLDDDTLAGGTGNDVLRGGKGNDVLFGEAGNDILYGDLGSDTMIGGLGADTFVLNAEAIVDSARADVIADFNPAEGDRLAVPLGVPLFEVLVLPGNAEFNGRVLPFTINDTVVVRGNAILAYIPGVTFPLVDANLIPSEGLPG